MPTVVLCTMHKSNHGKNGHLGTSTGHFKFIMRLSISKAYLNGNQFLIKCFSVLEEYGKFLANIKIILSEKNTG